MRTQPERKKLTTLEFIGVSIVVGLTDFMTTVSPVRFYTGILLGILLVLFLFKKKFSSGLTSFLPFSGVASYNIYTRYMFIITLVVVWLYKLTKKHKSSL